MLFAPQAPTCVVLAHVNALQDRHAGLHELTPDRLPHSGINFAMLIKGCVEIMLSVVKILISALTVLLPALFMMSPKTCADDMRLEEGA